MGYDPALIQDDENAEKFNCTICFEIAEMPKKCSRCSKIFCSKCIHEWTNVRKQCPFKCSPEDIMPIELDASELKDYHRINIRCNKKCSNIISLGHLNEHLSVCGLDNCSNFSRCQKISKFIIEGRKYCSQFCFEFCKMQEQDVRDRAELFHLIRKYKLIRDKMTIKFFTPENDETQDGYYTEE